MTGINVGKTQAAANRLTRAIKAMDVNRKNGRIDSRELTRAQAKGKAPEVAAVNAMRLSANATWFGGPAPAGTAVSDDVARVTLAQQQLRNIDEFAGYPVIRADGTADPIRRRNANKKDGVVTEAEIRNYGGLSALSQDLINYANPRSPSHG